MNNIRKRVFALTLVLTFFVSAFNFREIVNADEETRDPKFDINLEDFNGELIVKYKTNANIMRLAEEVKDEINLENVEIKSTTELESGAVSLLEIDKNANVEEVIKELEKDRSVECVDINYPILLSADPDYDLQWGLKNTGSKVAGVSGTAGCDIGIEAVRGITQGDESVLVAVIDTGIDINHPDLKDSIYVNPNETENGYDSDQNGYVDDVSGWNFCNGTNQVYEDYTDDDHGTHVAGIIAAGINEIGVEGVAPNVKILPIKFITNNSGYTYDAIEAIQYAERMGASIVNCSWGTFYRSEVLYNTIKESNMMFVCAAGNNALSFGQYPGIFNLDNVLSVAATNNTGALASFSNYGSSVDLAAPGSEIYSTLPEEQYGYKSGTSMAAPFVTGVAALIKSKEPALQADKIAERITAKVIKSEKLQDKVSSGGYLSAPAAVHNIGKVETLADTAAYGSGEAVFGNTLYRVGGYNEEGYTDAVSAFNIADNNWYVHSELNVPRMNAAVVNTSKYSRCIWAIGGYNGEILSDVESLNNDEWNIEQSLPKPLCAPAVVYLDDKIYVFGGLSTDGFSDDLYIYDFRYSEWKYAGKMPYKAAYATAQVVDDMIYIMGGVNESGVLDDVYAYDPNIGNRGEAWEAIPSMNYAKQNAQSIAAHGKLYVFGGVADEQIDFEQNLFTKNSEIMAAPFLNVVEQFDFATGEWTECIPMKTLRMGFSAATFFDRVLLTGGWNGSYVAEDEVYLGAQIPNNVRGKTDGDQMTFLWDPVNGADGYQLELDGTIVEVSAEQTPAYTITETVDSVHKFRVRARFGDAYAGWSDLIWKYRNSTKDDAMELTVSQDSWTEVDTQVASPAQLDRWYKVNVGIWGNLDVELQGVNSATTCQLEVYDSAGNFMTKGLDNSGVKQIDNLPVAMHTYYIRIHGDTSVSENLRLRVRLTKTLDSADIPSRVLAHSVENASVSDEPSIDSEGNAVQSLRLQSKNVQVLAAPPVSEIETTEEGNHLSASALSGSGRASFKRVTGQINDFTGRGYETVYLTKGQRLVAKVTPPRGSLEYGIYVYKKNSEEVTVGWYPGFENPLNKSIVETVAEVSGEYVILVMPRTISIVGEPYVLEYGILEASEYDAAEPNYSPLDIKYEGYLPIGGRRYKAPAVNNLNLDYDMDKDYYKIPNVQEGDKITMMLETNGNYAANLEKFNFEIIREEWRETDPDGWITIGYSSYQYDNTYFSGYYTKKANTKVVSFIAERSGDYYVEIRTTGGYYSRAAGDKYALTCTKVNQSEFNDAYEANEYSDFSNDFIMINKKQNPSLTELGSEPVTGTIDNQLDIDWYKVNVGAGQTLQAVLEGSDFARNNCKLYLCEQRGGNNQNPRLIKGGSQTLTIGQAGTYFVGVYADNWPANGNTAYTLRLDEVNTAENGFSISSPSYNNGSTLKMGEGNQISFNLAKSTPGMGNYWAELWCAWDDGEGYAKSGLQQVTLSDNNATWVTFNNLPITSCQNSQLRFYVKLYRTSNTNALVGVSNRISTDVIGNMTNEIQFQKQSGGKYIYSNNKEVIHTTDTADKNNPNGSTLLFSQSGLTTGTYTLMLTHRNETSYPVYLDVQFYDPYPTQESKIKFTKYGDDVAGGSRHNGKSWAGMSGYAGYFGSPIGRVRKQLDDATDNLGDFIIPSEGLSKLKYPENYFAGNNNIWLSTQYNNSEKQYPVLTNGQLLYTMLEFEVVSDTGITVNIAAFDARKTEFETRFNNYIPTENAPYKVEYTVKGVSEFSPEAETPMYFYIDNNSPLEQPQSVMIKNAFRPEGQITDWWKTNMNPQSEKWNAHINTESDILPLYYSDPANGMNWVFDTDRDYRDSSYLPPGYLEASTNGSSNNSIACNMGNYGVKTTYQMNVYNATDELRTFVYRVDTVSNLFWAVRDGAGNYKRFEVNGQSVNAICTGTVRETGRLYPTDTGDVTVKLPIVNEWVDIGGTQTKVNHATELEIPIPPHSFRTFYIDQVLATGDPGSIPTRVYYR